MAPRCRRGVLLAHGAALGKASGLSWGRLQALGCRTCVRWEGRDSIGLGKDPPRARRSLPGLASLPFAWFPGGTPSRGVRYRTEGDRRACGHGHGRESPAQGRAVNSSGPSRGRARWPGGGTRAPLGRVVMTPGRQQGGCSRRASPVGRRDVGKASAGQRGGPLAEPWPSRLPATAPLAASLSAPGTEPLCPRALWAPGRRGGRGHFEAGAGLAPGGWLIPMRV